MSSVTVNIRDADEPAAFEQLLHSERWIDHIEASISLCKNYSGRITSTETLTTILENEEENDSFNFTGCDDFIIAIIHIILTSWIIAVIIADIMNRRRLAKIIKERRAPIARQFYRSDGYKDEFLLDSESYWKTLDSSYKNFDSDGI